MLKIFYSLQGAALKNEVAKKNADRKKKVL